MVKYILIIFSVFVWAQQPQKSSFDTQKEKNLRTLSSKDKSQKENADFNLSNEQYQNKKYQEAQVKYSQNALESKTKTDKQKNYHNLGNSFMQEKKYEKAVEAYKNALRNNPNDEETRYNLALAKKKLAKNKNKNQKNQKDSKDQKNNKDQKKDQNQKDKKDQKNQQNQQKRPTGANKQRIDNLLNALSKAEQKTQEKVNANKKEEGGKQAEKDW